jgi:hypothetical protein
MHFSQKDAQGKLEKQVFLKLKEVTSLGERQRAGRDVSTEWTQLKTDIDQAIKK